MKKLRALFLTVASVLALAFAAVGLAACDDGTEYYSLTLTYEATQGTVTATSSKSDKGYEKDEEVTITVTAAENYTVGEVKVNDAAVELTEGKYTFKIAGNTTVTAAFTATTPSAPSGPETPGTPSTPSVTYYSVTLTKGEHGTASLSASDATEGYVAGEEVTLTLTPDAHYVVDEVKVNGTAVTLTGATYTFEVEGNTTVAVTFKQTEYHVTVNAPHTTVTIAGADAETVYHFGDTVEFTVEADEYYTVASVKVNDADAEEEEGTYTFTVEGDTEIAVVNTWELEDFSGEWKIVTQNSNFMQDKLTVTEDGITFTSHTATDGEERAISGATVEDDTLSFTLTPSGAYTFTLSSDINALVCNQGADTVYLNSADTTNLLIEDAKFFDTVWISKISSLYPDIEIDENGKLTMGDALQGYSVRILTLNTAENFESATLLIVGRAGGRSLQTLTVVDNKTIKITITGSYVNEVTFEGYIEPADIDLGITFESGYRSAWKQVGVDEDRHPITFFIKEKSFRFNDESVDTDANVTAEAGGGYSFTKEGTKYTFKLTEDNKALRLSYQSGSVNKVTYLGKTDGNPSHGVYVLDYPDIAVGEGYYGLDFFLSASQNTDEVAKKAPSLEIKVSVESESTVGGQTSTTLEGGNVTLWSDGSLKFGLMLLSANGTTYTGLSDDGLGWYKLNVANAKSNGATTETTQDEFNNSTTTKKATFATDGSITLTDSEGNTYTYVADADDKYTPAPEGEPVSEFPYEWQNNWQMCGVAGSDTSKIKFWIQAKVIKVSVSGTYEDYTTSTVAIKEGDDIVAYKVTTDSKTAVNEFTLKLITFDNDETVLYVTDKFGKEYYSYGGWNQAHLNGTYQAWGTLQTADGAHTLQFGSVNAEAVKWDGTNGTMYFALDQDDKWITASSASSVKKAICANFADEAIYVLEFDDAAKKVTVKHLVTDAVIYEFTQQA